MADLIPPNRNEFLTKEGFPTQRFIYWIESLTRQTNTSTEEIENQAIREQYPWARSPESEAPNGQSYGMFANPSKASDFDVIEVTGTTHTTAGNELLICSNTASLTVTLNPEPDHKEQVIIVRQGAGAVSVTSTKLISGKTTKKILRRYSAPHHIFTTEADSWSVI